MKAILIDVHNKNICFVEQNGLEDIYTFTLCTCITGVHVNRENVLYVDDEGLLKANRKGFCIRGLSQPLLGNGLLCGCNLDTGDSADTNATVERLEKIVTFIEYDVPPEVF